MEPWILDNIIKVLDALPTSRILYWSSSEYPGQGNSTKNNPEIEQNLKNLFDISEGQHIMRAKILENKETQSNTGAPFPLGAPSGSGRGYWEARTFWHGDRAIKLNSGYAKEEWALVHILSIGLILCRAEL